MTKASRPICLSQAKAPKLNASRLALMAIRETIVTWSKVCIKIDTKSSHSLCSIQCIKLIVTRVRLWLIWCPCQETKAERQLKCSQAGTELKISVRTWIGLHLTRRAFAFCKRNLSKTRRTLKLSMVQPWSKEWAASKVIEWPSQSIIIQYRKKKAMSKVLIFAILCITSSVFKKKDRSWNSCACNNKELLARNLQTTHKVKIVCPTSPKSFSRVVQRNLALLQKLSLLKCQKVKWKTHQLWIVIRS